MNEPNKIRPIVLGIAKRNNKILVGKGFDKVKNEVFYRALGEGIDFGETSSDALKREFLEEINAHITVKDYLGVEENIFTYKGKLCHEIVFLYSIEIPESEYKDEYIVNDDAGEYYSTWIDIDEFKSHKKILYPENIFKYI